MTFAIVAKIYRADGTCKEVSCHFNGRNEQFAKTRYKKLEKMFGAKRVEFISIKRFSTKGVDNNGSTSTDTI
jgi:hypothetical protein